MNIFLKNKNQSGSVLVTVVGILSLMLIFVSVAITIASTAHEQTTNEVFRQQAQYSAQSAVNSFVSNISVNNNITNLINSIAVGTSIESDEKYIDGMGNCRITITKNSTDIVTITAKTYYNSATATSSVMILGTPSVSTSVPRFDVSITSYGNTNVSNSFFTTGGVISNQNASMPNSSQVTSPVYVNGDLYLSNSASISQGTNNNEFSVVATGNIGMANSISLIADSSVTNAYINCGGEIAVPNSVTIGSPSKKINIYTNGISISNSVTLYSDVYVYKTAGATQAININNSPVIYGDVYIDGDLNMTNSVKIAGNLYVSGKVTLTNTVQITGSVYCNNFVASTTSAIIGGNIYSPNSITGYGAPSYQSKWQWQEDRDRAKLSIPEKPDIKAPDVVFSPFEGDAEDFVDFNAINNGLIYNASSVSTFDKSGRITGSIWNKDYIVKVKDKAIWLQLDVNSIGKSNIIIQRDPAYPDTPVYFYVPQYKSLSFSNGSVVVTEKTLENINNSSTFYLGNYKDTSKQLTKSGNVYWLMGKNSSISLSGGSSIEGYVYGPDSSFNAANGGTFRIIYSLDGVNVSTVDDICLIGAVVVDNCSFSNSSGIAFIMPQVQGLPQAPGGDVSGGSSSWSIDGYSRNS